MKPLLFEIKVKDNLIEEYKALTHREDLDRKLLLSILRLPAMTRQYQNALKRKHEKKEVLKNEKEAAQYLRRYQVDKDEEKFFDDFLVKLA